MNFNSDKLYKILGTALFLAFFWFFTEIVTYLIIGSIIGVAGQPLVKLIQKIKIKKKPFPNTAAAAISLIVMIMVVTGFAALLIPAVGSQAEDLMKIDPQYIESQWGTALSSVEDKMRGIGMLESNEELETYIVVRLTSIVQTIQLNNVFSALLGMTGSIFMGVFSILFMSFFFIKDDELFEDIVLLFVSEENQRTTKHILLKIKKMLSRYFIGIAIEISTMMLLITIGGLILGLKNALLIGFIGGLMNVIPYLGPLIGAFIASALVLMSTMYLGFDVSLSMVGGILLVFAISNMIDNFLLQPIIYSNSVNAHPLEIFIVIMVGGTMGGALGMIIAIPTYTIIRITAKEFLGDKIFIKRLMKDV